ncbi:ATPase, YjeE family [Synechococcus sp. PCC 7502]|uniref:tRNA (adenosine(37)-N6)-threonylcarbamoyltransferase complex ATPase subunit type 1 TsaE n=1 Tax=Synechococcus sp. PCC 7502 TaxID=1173263 RepID=UPI00029FAB32|nr:tRNA (adenosine(37)-N6)-threonylcarbamoyltransferase complex ATPase subunit type 1 TsaE [Synechococcus sp. PCC 7502]AFY74443.1 ATPase, YjeE family [Synechococcus sp. PCC 7502]
MLSLIANNLSDTQTIARIIANLLEAGSVLLLQGNLGSGKTTFIKELAASLGVKALVTSPTFTIIDEYDCGRLPLYHMDLYRLSNQEVNELHLQEYWRGIDFPLGIVAIEWAERLELLPETYLSLNFSLLEGSDRRRIVISAKGEQYLKIISCQRLLDFNV